MMDELKRRLEDLERLSAIADSADRAMMEDFENPEKEKAFEEAYKAEYSAFMAVVDLVVKISNGKIDEKTARIMVRAKRNEILALLA